MSYAKSVEHHEALLEVYLQASSSMVIHGHSPFVTFLHEEFNGVVVDHHIKRNRGFYCWANTKERAKLVRDHLT